MSLHPRETHDFTHARQKLRKLRAERPAGRKSRLARAIVINVSVFACVPLLACAAIIPACSSSPPSTEETPSGTAIAPLDPTGVHYGKSYAEWQSEWYRWFFGAPGSTHPILDATGVHCAVNQNPSSPVFFLGGTVGGKASRKCQIPKGKAIFFPIINAGVDNGGVPPAEVLTEPQLLAAATGAMKDAKVTASLDGKDIPDLARYLVPPTRFNYTVPPGDNLYRANGAEGVSGLIEPVFATGFYLLLPPLARGVHQLKFYGSNVSAGQTFVSDVTYELSYE